MNNIQLSSPAKKDDINHILKGVDPSIAELLRTAHSQRFRVSQTRRNHFKVQTPEHYRDQAKTFAPGTPSDPRSMKATRTKLRHIGVRFDR